MLETDGTVALARFYRFLETFQLHRLVEYHISSDDSRLLATFTPLVPDYIFSLPQISPEAKYQLSRFALLRADRGAVVLESPLSPGRITLYDWPAAALAAELARPADCRILSGRFPMLSKEEVILLLRLPAGSGFAVDSGQMLPSPMGKPLPNRNSTTFFSTPVAGKDGMTALTGAPTGSRGKSIHYRPSSPK